jgi:sulfide dehydrogenase [flavocytochrome c] flavoprotein chain
VILDPREKPAAKAKGFLEAYDTLYKDYIEYRPNSNITKIDLDKKTIFFDKFDAKEQETTKESLVFDDANIIPSNKASKLLLESGLELTAEGWGRVKAPTFRSLNDDNVYLVGDVLGEYPFPKSAQMAHSCGIILGEQIGKRLNKEDPKEGSVFPHNVCYSLVSKDSGIYVTHEAYQDVDGSVKVKTELFQDIDKKTFDSTKAWYAGITSNIFE